MNLPAIFRIAAYWPAPEKIYQYDSVKPDVPRNIPFPWITAIASMVDQLEVESPNVMVIGIDRYPACANSMNPSQETTDVCCKEGHSVALLSAFLAKAWITGIDIRKVYRREILPPGSPANVNQNSTLVQCDGISFLKHRNKSTRIDLLYLDAWDLGEKDCAENHLKCLQVSAPFMADNHIIAIDDADFRFDGKAAHCTPWLLSHGYIPLLSGRVAVWLGKRQPIDSNK